MIVYYDGVCALCNRFVRWALRRDRKRRLLFAALDSGHGTRLRRAFPETKSVDSIIVRDGDRVFVKSDAILAIAQQLGPAWRLTAAWRLLPRPLRDLGYDMIAARRYRWFGRLDACPLPAADERDRFLDS
ncbi:MAG: thiol-disulfide oxidoreductase DCC family protein [Gemmatimonadaceae bacterium]